MASGSSGRPNSASKGFDFASDDILCSYEDNNNNIIGPHSDPAVIATSSNKDFLKSRMARQSGYAAPTYNQPEDDFSQDVMSYVDKSMKKYSDNLMRFLEGISSRLSQLELYCYNLDKSIGEMRADLVHDHGEADGKLSSLEKSLQEVHRSVQILRDKQELAETQKELAKLQLAQKESPISSHSHANEDRASPVASDSRKTETESETHNQLALALPHQVAPQPQPQPQPQPATHSSAPSHTPSHGQQQAYYLSTSQFPNQSPLTQHSQSQYMPSDLQYMPPMQDPTRVSPQLTQSQVNQTPLVQHPQQWPHQTSQQVPSSQLSVQNQMRPSSPAVYSTYQPNQTVNAPPPETISSSMQMQVPYSGVPHSDSNRVDAMPYGYTGAGRTPQQPLPQPSSQQIKGSFGGQQSDRYITAGAQSALPPGSSYMVYDSEGGRAHPAHSPHYQQGVYLPNAAIPNMPPTSGTNLMIRNPNPMRGHPYGELIDKLVSMGFRGDHAASVIQRMEESGQPVDFNAVLDRLSSPQRGW